MTQDPEPIYEYASLELVGYGTITVRVNTAGVVSLDTRVSNALQHESGWLDVERHSITYGLGPAEHMWSPLKVNLTHFALIEPTTNPEEQQ